MSPPKGRGTHELLRRTKAQAYPPYAQPCQFLRRLYPDLKRQLGPTELKARQRFP
jgi:hypothetical protein